MNRVGASYAVAGAFAVNVWVAKERVRSTVDIDLYGRLSSEQIEKLQKLMADEGIQLAHVSDLTMRKGLEIQRFLCLPDDIVLDLITARDPYGGEPLLHAVPTSVAEIEASVLSPEDLILHKASANRPHDWTDIEAIRSARGPELDLAYIEKWARSLRVWSRLKPKLRAP